MRQRINCILKTRDRLNLEEWFKVFFQSQHIPYAVVSFAYHHLEKYSGLDMGRVWPSDRLQDELYWSQVCWFDWEFNLYEDFWESFGVDISDRFDQHTYQTVEELVLFFHHQLIPLETKCDVENLP